MAVGHAVITGLRLGDSTTDNDREFSELVKRLDVREDSSKWLLAKSRLCVAGMLDQIAIRRWHCDRRIRFCDMTLSATI